MELAKKTDTKRIISKETHKRLAFGSVGERIVSGLSTAEVIPVPIHSKKPYIKGKINVCIHVHSDLDKKTFACWGDYWVKVCLKNALERHFGDEINMDVDPAYADVIIYGFGSPFEKRSNHRFFYNEKSLNIAWHYSHPEHMSPSEANKYNHIFVASHKWIEEMNSWGGVKSTIDQDPLFACTDFKPQEPPSVWGGFAPDVLFIGNARGNRGDGRKSVLWLDEIIGENKDLSVFLYGAKWERESLLWSHKWYKGQYFPYSQLPSAYGAAKINLIDGHDKMRNQGFVSAKVFDTIASEGWVVMEYNDGVEDIFGEDQVLMFKDKGEMEEMIKWSMDHSVKVGQQKPILAKIAQKYSYDLVVKRIFSKIKELI